MARILHLIKWNQRRGAEVFAAELADHLRAAGHEVRVLAIQPTHDSEVLDVEVAGRNRKDPAGFARTVRAARWADVVVGCGSAALLTGAAAAAVARRPFVYRNIGDPGVWGRARFADLRIGTPMRSAAAVVALYPGARTTLVGSYRLDPGRVRVIPRGVPPERFSPTDDAGRAAARSRLGLDSDRSWMAYLGALSVEKDPALAIDVLRRLPPAVGLVMAGGGPLEAEIRAAAGEFGDRLRVLGSIRDVRDVLAAADLLVLTSHTEGIPGAVIEAGLSGLPCASTSVGGVPHVIADGESGRLVHDRDPDAFAAAVLDVIEHRDEYGRAAVRRCTDGFSMTSVGAAWEQVIADVTARRRTLAGRGADRGDVLHVVASNERRGAEIFVDQLDTALAARGRRSRVTALVDSPQRSELPFLVLGPGRFRPSTLLRLRHLAARHSVVVAHGGDALLPVSAAALLTRRPFVYRSIGDPRHWGDVRWAGWRIGAPLRRAARVVAIGATAREALLERHRLAADRVVVIPNGVDVERFAPADTERRAAARRRWGLAEADVVFGYIGALAAEKRPGMAITAVAARGGARLLVAGGGPLARQLAEQAEREAPGRVVFTGALEDTGDVLAAIDGLLLPSITEGAPAVLIEAALSGVPAIATDVGACREILDGLDAGSVVPADDPEAFVDAVRDADPTRRVDPRSVALAAELYGMRHIADEWDRLLAPFLRPS